MWKKSKGIGLSMRMVILLMLGILAILSFIILLGQQESEVGPQLECEGYRRTTEMTLLNYNCCDDWDQDPDETGDYDGCEDIVEEEYLDIEDCELDLPEEEWQDYFCL